MTSTPRAGDRAKPITLTNLHQWARETLRVDRLHYRPKQRPITPRRLWHAVEPRLDRPIFVIGAARSGTTFLGDAIGQIPEVTYHNEPVATKAAGRYVYERRWRRRPARHFYRGVYRWLSRIHLDGDLRFAEKTPTNSFLVPFLDWAFPGAQFVHIIRDGRDAAVSLMRLPWLREASRGTPHRETGGAPMGPYARFWVEPERREEFESTSDLHRAIWSWRRHTESALADGRALPAVQYHELRYESLVSDPDVEAEKILDFLGVEGRASRTAFLDATRRADAGSAGRWRRSLGLSDLEQVEAEAGRLLRELGYVSS